ncbi:hypothetical protein BECAL_02967 [Bellilinea caldifistulae]|uniref:Uncharacterized protein n=1 Tax=Bellilinea caldifistulae TaxID=360411 RepID=A0A0N8GM81_9CHLR|nr:hypothetical protein [Bellilinea caldifistulae]KPL74562.1 hypothetical protein AC812_12260 [Bellilinea caldifistulae]GAP11774.1 hypothetical protein BECAL_02967 [Bellilinea caldifistulae]
MKSLFAVFYLPLWMLVAVWIVLRRKQAFDEADMAMRAIMLNDIYYALPVPKGRLERMIVTAIIRYIDREKVAMLKMSRMGVSGIGVLPK